MSVQATFVTDASDDLTETDGEILDVLKDGRATKGYIVDATGRHRNTIGMRLEILEAKGHVRNIHESTALYELADDPRGE